MEIQVFSILGTFPEFKALIKPLTKLRYISPFNGFPFNVLTFTLPKTFFLRAIICSKNSGLNCSGGRSSKFCNLFSFVKGLTIVEQSRSLKYALINLRILFLGSCKFLVPSKTFSKYSLGVIFSPLSSISCKEKSRHTQRKEGNRLDNSSGSVSVSPALSRMNFDKLITKFKFCKALSSIPPMELYKK